MYTVTISIGDKMKIKGNRKQTKVSSDRLSNKKKRKQDSYKANKFKINNCHFPYLLCYFCSSSLLQKTIQLFANIFSRHRCTAREARKEKCCKCDRVRLVVSVD